MIIFNFLKIALKSISYWNKNFSFKSLYRINTKQNNILFISYTEKQKLILKPDKVLTAF